MTALMDAINKQDVSRVGQLIAQGTNVNTLDANGNAPLVMAAYKGNPDIVGMLLQAGADVTAVDPDMKASALHAAAYAGNADAAKLLVQYHINIDLQGPFNGYTALHDAIWQGNLETAKVLIDSGAKLTLQSLQGETPLAFARLKHRSAIAALIEQKLASSQ